MGDCVIKPAKNQSFQAFVRYVTNLADGGKVQIDTSKSPYAVVVDAAVAAKYAQVLKQNNAAKQAARPAAAEAAPPATPAADKTEAKSPAKKAPAKSRGSKDK